MIELHGCGLKGCRLPIDHVGHGPVSEADDGRASTSQRPAVDPDKPATRALDAAILELADVLPSTVAQRNRMIRRTLDRAIDIFEKRDRSTEDGIRAMPWSERTMLEAIERAPVLAGICRNAVVEEWAAADRAGDEQARVWAALLAVCSSADRRQERMVSTNTIRAILAGDQ